MWTCPTTNFSLEKVPCTEITDVTCHVHRLHAKYADFLSKKALKKQGISIFLAQKVRFILSKKTFFRFKISK